MSLNKLTWNNYKDVEQKIRAKYGECMKPCISYLMWSYYGTTVYWIEKNRDIFFIGESHYEPKRIEQILSENLKISLDEYSDSKYIILIPSYIEDELNYINETSEIIKEKSDQKIIFIDGLKNKNLFNENPLFSWNVNYIYDINDLNGFPGKKNQKKRNHLNYYLNNFKDKTIIKKYANDNFNEVINFLEREITSSETSSKEEKIAYKELLSNFDKEKMSGIIVYYDNEIIGFTFGYSYDNYYEIIIERCSKEFRGLYQFIITENIKLNIDTQKIKYIDRQDDMGEENLRKSKLSYNPIKVIESNVYKIETKSTH